jgi:hypothetical protein
MQRRFDLGGRSLGSRFAVGEQNHAQQLGEEQAEGSIVRRGSEFDVIDRAMRSRA